MAELQRARPFPSTCNSGHARAAAPSLHPRFEEWVLRTPDAIAVASGQEEISYAELDRRAGLLAEALHGLGVGPDTLVGVCVERSPEAVVAILGVLKAGGAYLPLDPDHPEERLRFMWRDSRSVCPPGAPSVLLGSRRLSDRVVAFGSGEDTRVLLLDSRGFVAATAPARSPRRPRAEPGDASRDLAYVIYTSGSTGVPKGVMVERRGVANVAQHAAEALRVTPESRVLQLASLSFDASALEIFTALASGARLVLTPRETLLSGEALAAELERRAVTTLAIPPSLLDKVPDGVTLPALRSVVVGGEACSAGTARRWAPGRVFVNAYAPTEATIYTTAMAWAGDVDLAPPLGRAIPGTVVEVLDEEGRIARDGEVGELCLGGVGLARGYAARPGLTAERFVPDGGGGRPREAVRPGERLYRSGDLGRRSPDGTLEFVGRADHQVKVRGVRIELGEVEARLLACPGVRQAVVSQREDVPGDPRLVGYVVPAPGAHLAVPELRSVLGERLPEAMVPSAFVFLDAFPQTPTGKIDRRSLPAPGPERPDVSTDYVPPAGPLETSLAAIWEELLGLEGVGVEDDLFELGGHSLVVAQIANRVRQELGLELPLFAPFEHSTVRALATYLKEQVEPGEEGRARAVPAGPRAEATLRPPPVEPAPRDRPIPVSFPQERVWFLLQLAPGSLAYNFQFSLRFRGELSIPALGRTLAELVRRHEILRTDFPAEDGRPVQRIHPPFAPEMPMVDLSGLPAERREVVLRRLVRAEVRRGFEVTRLPLLRWTLYRLAGDDHLWLQVEHHFVHDGWSLSVFLRELEALYGAYAQGEPSPLPEPEVQYADFAVWQRRWMEGEVLEEQLDHWRRKLAGSPPLLELPADRPRPRAHSFRGDCLRVDLDAELYRRVRAFSRRHGATLFMTMLAAFDALLYRYTGQGDVVIGSGLANRRLREIEGLVGMVVNTLVIRSTVDARMGFRELLEEVRRTTLELHLYQDLPFEKLVEKLQPDRDLSRNPLFQVLFSFHDAPVPDLDLPGLETELFEWHNGSAKTDLNVVVKPMAEQRVGRRASAHDEVLTMVWEFSGDLFDRTTIERMWGHYQVLLDAVVADPDRPVAELPLLTTPERHELLVERPATDDEPLPARSLADLFAAQAVRRPDAVAVHHGGSAWTYGELASRSDRLARRLVTLGVGPDVPVGLCVERSFDLVVGVLGILQAGGAYVPLDPDYPEERLRFMLDDALGALEAPVVVTQEGVASRVAGSGPDGGRARRLVLLDGREDLEPPAAGAPPAPDPVAESLAYVIYTSGSTGRPKGVQVTHGHVVRLLRATGRWFEFGPDDVWTLFHSYAFDFSVWELWGALAFGGRLVLVSREVARSPEAFHELLLRGGVTVLNQTPSAFRHLERVHAERGYPPTALRRVVFGGEALEPSSLASWADHHGLSRPRLVNMYGITETTVHVTYRPVTLRDLERPGASPIGEPIPDLAVHVVDPRLRPVPVGVSGEMYVGGAGVARGYLERPGLTAERFVPDPFDPRPGARLYRTGDLGRRKADGDLEYQGRIDHQVKVRGFRIELGEIEAALQELPDVTAAAVVARSGGAAARAAEDSRLVAFLVTGEDPAPASLETTELRRALAKRLPEYMVPASFVLLETLPLSPTGKVDRRALAAREPDAPAAAAGRTPAAEPRTPTEELVAGLWREVLGLERVGLEDDFFQVGGHSLLATRLLARLRKATGAEMPLSDVFDAPTVAALARRVELRLREVGGAGPEAEAQDVAIPRRGEAGPAPLSFAQERLWFLHRFAPGDAAYNIARALELSGPLDAPALAGALAAVARRHEVLRSRFETRGGRPVQVADAAPPPLPVVDLRGLPADREGHPGTAVGLAQTRALARAESRRAFDLARGPMLRSALVRLGGEEHVLLLTFHHAAFDGWSMEVFYRELGAAYRDLSAGRPVDLPPIPVQYADFAAWQRHHLASDRAGDRLERLLAYWRERLAGAPPSLELPADRPRPRILSSRGARQARPVAPSLPEAVAELALHRGATPFMVHLTAFAALLHRYTGRTDLVVGTPMANRDRTEVEDLIGFFANSLVLRVDAGGDVPFEELLSRVRGAVLGAHAHQEIPFEKLVEELAPERDLSRTPLYQVSFQVEEERPDQLELPEVTVERLELARAETKLDLSVALTRTPEGLLARAQYSTDLFDGTRIRRLLGHLERLLEGALDHPELPLSHLPLLGRAERLQVVAEWNALHPTARATTRKGAGRTGILDLFEAQVARSPDAVAVSFGSAQRTYAALEAESAHWARRLRHEGVGPDVLVAVLLERSIEMVVGLVAILRAGGAHIALDPESPPERLAAMLEDSGARVVLTQERLAPRLPESPWERVGEELVVSRASATTETSRTAAGGKLRPYPLGLRAGTRAGSPDPERLAYAVFTSGSTGRPKAAMNTHRGLLNRLLWMGDDLRPGPDDRFLQKTPLTFDVSVWEVWLPLVTGGRLIVARPDGHRDPGYLLETVEREGVSVLHFVPSLLRVFLGQPGFDRLRSLRRVFSGGEALPPELVAAFRRRLSSELHNSYGPAEASVAVAGWPCPPAGEAVRVPVGRPIAGARLLAVDRHLRPVPVGVPGELAIGGVPVGRGYLRRPALTAERFVPDPFGSEPGRRLYRTGDLCRTGPSGAIEYLERLDFQVKVRGQRVETGEIEAALREHPAVEEAVVVGRIGPDSGGSPALAGFVSTGKGTERGAGSGSAPDGDELRDHLRRLLPEAMVPTTVEVLEELPRGRTGKVDRRALARRPPADRRSLRKAPGQARAAPRTSAERELAELWAEVLGIDGVGVHDEFFELGGNSISAAVVINRVQELLGDTVHVVALFEAPTVAGLAELLTRRHPAAARRWGVEAPDATDGEGPPATAPTGAPPLERLPRATGDAPALFPASFAQERLWFLHRMVPDSAVYNLPLALRLSGRLRPAVLARTLREIARRQEVLRTTLPEQGGSPVQRVDPRARLPLPLLDLEGLPPELRDREARRVARLEAERPFDLGRGPLVRARLLRLGPAPGSPGEPTLGPPAGDGPEEHRLLVTLHHAVFDGWSVGVLLEELAGIYGALEAGEPVTVPEPPVQYAEYAAWQRRWLAGDVLEEQLGYWRDRLAGAPPVLELPTDHPRPAVQSFRGGRVPCRLEPELSAALTEIGRSTGATPFMVLLAAFMALLARYSGARDLVVGSPVAGRNRAELEGLLGVFVNTLPLRAELGGDPPFEEVVSAVRQAAVGAFAHQDLPFERLVEETAPERSLAHAPLFQVLFGLQNASRRARSVAGVDLEVLDSDLEAAKFDLVVSLGETPEAIRGSFQYNADLFERATIERMARHFRNLLAGVAEDPRRALSRLPLLSDAERRELLVAWNDTATAYPRERSIPEVFEAVARRRPDAVALRQGDRWWTYGELLRRAERVAALLEAEGVGPEVLVGLAAERSPELVAGLLGTLAAGGAYLPLDAAYPPERLSFMLEDARAPVLLASEGVADGLAPAMERVEGLRLLSLERAVGAGAAGGTPEAPPAIPRSGPRSLAYTVYTSGSTGRPKGVAVEHRSVLRLVRGADYVPMGEEEVFFQLAPVPFDASTFEIWGALLNGGRLEIPAPGVPSLGELGRDLETSRVTHLFLTTGLFNQMVDAELPRLATVRHVITGGEVASRSHMARMRETRTEGETLVHAYGPTEGTTYTTCAKVDPLPDGDGPSRTVPIGGPIANTRVYLLDPAPDGGAEAVPVGVAGELYLGGDGVARGYLARPALTAAVFVPDPFAALSGGAPGGRLYRTGDLARWLADGRVEFLGRIDRQVKLRGFRIELGEVEAALGTHPAVRRAVAVVREDRPGDRRLVAYAVPPEGAEADPGELRSYLAERLPEHMVPSAVVTLPELPLDPNGKVDRRALPAPELHEGAPARRGRTAPRGPVEEIVAEAWSDVLGAQAPSVHDDFFDQGGHSLLATRLVARLADVTGVEVPLRRLFEGPTIAELARAVEELQRGGAAPGTLPLARRERPDRPVPASWAQERLWFLSRLDPGSTVYNIPAVFRFRGALRPPALARALREVVRRHEALRTTLFEVDGRPYQRVAPAAPGALPWIDLAALPAGARPAEAARVAHRSAHQSFDLETGPVVSAWLLRLSDREHRLAWCVHHAAADGWSLGIVLDELTALYGALSRGLPSPLPQPPVQYADYAVWQRRALDERAVNEQLAYWRRHLEGAPRELTLPADRPRSPVQTYRGGRAKLDVAAPLLGRLQDLAAGEGATLFMLLLAALDAVLARWSGQGDVLVGSPVAGRSRTEVEGLVGMFLNTLVLRLDLSPVDGAEPSFRELLRRARESALGAYTHQDVPFEMLLEDLEVERELSRTPLFQVFLNVTNFPRNEVPLEDLDVEVMEGGAGLGSKFDLTLYASQGPEGLTCNLVYNADLFDAPRMHELLDQLHGLLAQVAADPDRPYTSYSLRTPTLASMLPEPDAELTGRWEGPAHAVFAARAAEAPDRVAVAGDGVTWTYGALERAAARLAGRLAEAGVGRGDRVVIYAQRSAVLPLALLGTLRAGAAFGILDPAHPARYLAEVVEAARPRAALRLLEAGPLPKALEEALVRCGLAADLTLPEAGAALSAGGPPGAPDGTPEPPVGPDDEAYLGFTSGTTGSPKGIVGRHGSLSHFVPWFRDRLDLRPGERHTLLSGLAHDPVHRDVFSPLQLGATLCVPPADDVLHPGRLFDWLARERVAVANLTPAMGQLVLQGAEDDATGRLGTLRRALFVGDQLPARLVDAFRRIAPEVVCVNFYGSTETARALGYFEVPGEASRRFGDTLPLHGGIDETELLVLGPAGRPAGVAELGEVIVRSPHLSRGYLEDPRRTAERFRPDPFSAGSGAGGRIYYTGDLGRYRPGGEVEISGRVDDQVQVRGFRVEPGAVESALAEHPGVSEAAVVIQQGPEGRYLVAYVVPAAGAPLPGAEELRSHLGQRLPAYGIPGVFVPMDTLPLTPSAKLDRAALPDPDPGAATRELIAPDTPMEELLAGIWEELLQADRVGAGDDFFALGGHSLLATRVVSRLRSEIGLELPLRSVFERPRLRDLAEELEERLLAEEAPSAVP